MAKQTFRILGEPPELNTADRAAVAREIARLQELVARAPATTLVRLERNPSGPLGEYVALLLDAAGRGLAPRIIVPLHVRLRYGRRPWFTVGAEALDAFTAFYADRLAKIRAR